ncbi:MAG: hypothetical protein Q9213_002908 [Squamulea squamosa]
MFEYLAPVIERRLEIRGHEGPDKPVKQLYRYITSKDAVECATDDWRNHGSLVQLSSSASDGAFHCIKEKAPD